MKRLKQPKWDSQTRNNKGIVNRAKLEFKCQKLGLNQPTWGFNQQKWRLTFYIYIIKKEKGRTSQVILLISRNPQFAESSAMLVELSGPILKAIQDR